eukprot:3663381-Rhodomonas_salina.1
MLQDLQHFMQRASLQDLLLQCFKTGNASESRPATLHLLLAKGFSSRPPTLHAKGFSSRPPTLLCATAATCYSSNLLLSSASLMSNMQQQQPSSFQHFINFKRATAATFYFPMLHQFQTCYSSNLLLSNASSISNVQQQQPSTFHTSLISNVLQQQPATFQCFINFEHATAA